MMLFVCVFNYQLDHIRKRKRNFILLDDVAETHVNELKNDVASCTLKTNQVFPVLLVVMLHSCSRSDFIVSDVPGHKSTLN